MGESYYLNCHKYHANFYDGAWHTLYYSPAGYNKYNLNPAHHSYDGVSMTYKSAHRVTVLYDTAYLHFTRGSSHEMSPKKVNFRTADNINFFYNSWSPAYLDIHSTGIDLYGSADNAENQNDSVGTFSNVRKQVSAKWINENEQSNVLMLKVNGKVTILTTKDMIFDHIVHIAKRMVFGQALNPQANMHVSRKALMFMLVLNGHMKMILILI